MGQCTIFGNDSVAQYYNCGASANLNIVGALSIDCWIKIGSPFGAGTRRILFDRGTGGVGGYTWAVNDFTLAGRWLLSFTKTAVLSDDSTVEIQKDRLTHVAVVWNGINNVLFYRDGLWVQTMVEANAILPAPAATSYVDALTGAYKFCGCLYNLNIYNRALTATEILYNKEHPNNPIRYGLQLGLTQESFTGGVWKDKSPNGYDGTPVGSPILNPCTNIAGRNVSL